MMVMKQLVENFPSHQNDGDFGAAEGLLLLGRVDQNLILEGGQRAADRDRTQLERRQRRRVDADALRVVDVVVCFLVFRE